MTVYRIAKTKHIRNLSGTGARMHGGRWNRKGIGILYTSESRALATVEYLVHVPSAVIKHEFNILINPSHPDMSHVTISHVEEFTFDERLLL